MTRRFNIRVYGIWVADGRLLVNEELIRGRQVVKLPGGGLEWGEGIVDCLKREWMEELGLEIVVEEHFYTTAFFQPSAYDDSQVISIYYRVSVTGESIFSNNIASERTFWMPVDEVGEDTFTLPIDRVVGGLMRRAFQRSGLL